MANKAGSVQVEASITAQNTFTPVINFSKRRLSRANGWAQLSVAGVSDSTVTLQRSLDGGVTWVDVEAYTANTQKEIHCETAGVLWRVGVKTGEYGTDTVLAGIYA